MKNKFFKSSNFFLVSFIAVFMSLIYCRKISNVFSESEKVLEDEEINNTSMADIPSKIFRFRDIESSSKGVFFYDGQDSYEMEEIAIPLYNLVEPKSYNEKEYIRLTNYTPVLVKDITVNIKISEFKEIILFKLDSISPYSFIDFKYSDIFDVKDTVLYTISLEKENLSFIKNNMASLSGSIVLGWDKGKNSFLDKISTIKAQWNSKIRDYGRANTEKNGDCDNSYCVMDARLVRLFQAAIINKAFLLSQDEFRQQLRRSYMNNDLKIPLTDLEKDFALDRLLSFTNFRFGLYRGYGGVAFVGKDDFHTCSFNDVREVLCYSTVQEFIDKGKVRDPELYPEKTFLKVDSLGGKYLINRAYESAFGPHSQMHEFGHNIGFSHKSNFTYGNTVVTNKEYDNKGNLVDVQYYMESEPLVYLISHKYLKEKFYPIREDNYFRYKDDMLWLKDINRRPQTYCELYGQTPKRSNYNHGEGCADGCCVN